VSYDTEELATARAVTATGTLVRSLGAPILGLGVLSAQSARRARGEDPLEAWPYLAIGLGLGGLALGGVGTAIDLADPSDPGTLLSPASGLRLTGAAMTTGALVTGMWGHMENRAAADVSHRPIDPTTWACPPRPAFGIAPILGTGRGGATGLALVGAW
jgi:hypothetical protein